MEVVLGQDSVWATTARQAQASRGLMLWQIRLDKSLAHGRRVAAHSAHRLRHAIIDEADENKSLPLSVDMRSSIAQGI